MFFMIFSGKDISYAKNCFGFTPLHILCINGHTKIVDMVLQQQKSGSIKINLNSKDDMGWTPFHLACLHGKKEVAQLLIDYSDVLDIGKEILSFKNSTTRWQSS